MRIVLCYPVEDKHVKQIQGVAPDATIVDAGQEHIAHEILTADVFCGHAKVPVPWDQTVSQGRLRWIQSSAAGMDHCLVPAVVASDILVTSASGLFADQVAEHTLALLTATTRSLPAFFRAQQRREFIRRPTKDLHRSTVGIIGFGGNGRRLAEVLAPFHVRILATDLFPYEKPAYVEQLLPADQLNHVLAESDFVVLCVPLNEDTRGMIGKSVFAEMKQGAVLVNVARGPVVVEDDLVDAMRTKQLGGAALDVTENEPLDSESPLWEMPNVIITPHVGAQSATRNDDATKLFCENLKRFLSGMPLHNVVDKKLGFPIPRDACR